MPKAPYHPSLSHRPLRLNLMHQPQTLHKHLPTFLFLKFPPIPIMFALANQRVAPGDRTSP
ncbi:unnamed protein product [Dibothriocephalus latus]|uniref:Uncharacterized protein n=1 Tax=Dibothriocephalus latus TaxID=60516 RepID=A0A3P7NP02_DIBLA|nr:unnamed protein product [Dibothriocephalus latus]